MSQNITDIFSKLRPDERVSLFKDLANVRGEITVKGESPTLFRFLVMATSGEQQLHCSVPLGFPQPQKEVDVLGSFFLGGERYFFKTPVSIEGDLVILRMDTDLFRLQRRQNYRIKIPESYKASLLISVHNKIPTKLKGQLLDLSSGGCRIALVANAPILESGDRLEGHITIGNRESLEIEATVNHHKIENRASAIKQIFGIEFKPLTSMLEGKLFAITMDLHREFFSRLNTKN